MVNGPELGAECRLWVRKPGPGLPLRSGEASGRFLSGRRPQFPVCYVRITRAPVALAVVKFKSCDPQEAFG